MSLARSPSFDSNTALVSAITPSTSHVGGSKQRSRHYTRYSPYPNPRHSLHQLNIIYLGPAYVEDLVDIVIPRLPRHGFEAVLEAPPRNRRDDIEGNAVEQGPVRRVFAWIAGLLGFLEQKLIGAL